MRNIAFILGVLLATVGAVLLGSWAAGTCQLGGVCDMSSPFARYILPKLWYLGVALLALGILLLTLRAAFRRISRRSVLSGRI